MSNELQSTSLVLLHCFRTNSHHHINYMYMIKVQIHCNLYMFLFKLIAYYSLSLVIFKLSNSKTVWKNFRNRVSEEFFFLQCPKQKNWLIFVHYAIVRFDVAQCPFSSLLGFFFFLLSTEWQCSSSQAG